MPRRAQPARLRPLLLLLAAALLAAPTCAARALYVVATAASVVAEDAGVAPTAAAGPVTSAIAGQGTLGPTQAPVVAEAPAAGMSAWVAAGSDAVPGGIQQFGIWTIGRLIQILVAVFLLVLVCFFMIVRHAARPRTQAAPYRPAHAPRCAAARGALTRPPAARGRWPATGSRSSRARSGGPLLRLAATTQPRGPLRSGTTTPGARAGACTCSAARPARRGAAVRQALTRAAHARSGLIAPKIGGYSPGAPPMPALVSSQARTPPEDWDKLPSWA